MSLRLLRSKSQLQTNTDLREDSISEKIKI